jgi:hypothetical protein
MAGIAPSLARRKEVVRMPAKNSKTESDGFSAEERAAMKDALAHRSPEAHVALSLLVNVPCVVSMTVAQSTINPRLSLRGNSVRVA